MTKPADLRFWIVPAAWAVVVTALFGTVFLRLPWPFVDLYNSFYKATAFTWPETFAQAFGAGVEYRPLMIIGVKLAHQLVGLRAWCYQALVLLQFASVLLALVWIFRPTTRARAWAACLALACVVGLHTSRVLFMFMPLNVHSFGVVLLLAAVILALSPRSRLGEWAFLPLTLFALLLLESGVLVVAVTLVLWKMKAPNAGGRAALATVAASAVYVAVRVGFGTGEAPAAYAETGIGFADVDAAGLTEIFGRAPWMLWMYNVVASLLTVIASEPRAGRYRFVEALLHGNVPMWVYVHVITSVLTTAIVGFILARSRLREARDRYIAAVGATLVVVGSALGFLYTRDRIALSAGIGYAMLVYVAAAALLGHRTEPEAGREVAVAFGRRTHLALARGCVAVIAVGWLMRSGEMYLQLRDAGWENYREWTVRYEELGGSTRPQTDVLMMLRDDVLSNLPLDPRRDSLWTYVLFERKFDPIQASGE